MIHSQDTLKEKRGWTGLTIGVVTASVREGYRCFLGGRGACPEIFLFLPKICDPQEAQKGSAINSDRWRKRLPERLGASPSRWGQTALAWSSGKQPSKERDRSQGDVTSPKPQAT